MPTRGAPGVQYRPFGGQNEGNAGRWFNRRAIRATMPAAVGFPGAVDGYQVNFRVPPDTAKGVATATIQMSAAWIAGPEVRITVQ